MQLPSEEQSLELDDEELDLGLQLPSEEQSLPYEPELDELDFDELLEVLLAEADEELDLGLQEPSEQSLPYEPELDEEELDFDELLELQSEPLHPLSFLEPQSEP